MSCDIYVDIISVVWPHGKDELQAFLEYINSIHSRIQFTRELEQNNKLPFPDVLITKTREGTLTHSLQETYPHKQIPKRRVTSPPNTYLKCSKHSDSRSKRLADNDHRKQELTNITIALKNNGYKNHIYKKLNITNKIHDQKTPSNRERKPCSHT